jgi:hypothetical protein
MAINTLLSAEDSIGEVFTPMEWAKWLLLKYGVFESWRDGATVCDPTAGKGVFAFALLELARDSGFAVSNEMLSRLVLIEKKQSNVDIIKAIANSQFGIIFPQRSLYCADIITHTPHVRADILVGNPPWSNFTDLPDLYKEKLKPYFIDAGLVPNKRSVLLGSSRTDIAALVLKITLGKILNLFGRAHFFVPLSLFTGDDAHIGFRDYKCFSSNFGVNEVYEFNKTKIFDGVGTSYCMATFTKDVVQTFPVQYFRENNNDWVKHEAVPLKAASDPWRVYIWGKKRVDEQVIDVRLKPNQKPRQGVNTCGANDIFIFKTVPEFIDQKYLFPLATKGLWNQPSTKEEKWIFLPYNTQTGRPLNTEEIKMINGYDYLLEHQERLKERKGTLIGSANQKGLWWSLLGVGPYSFAPYKVIWQAYGKTDFKPIILTSIEGRAWQGNQAMHAFIPCWSLDDAERVLLALKNPQIAVLLSEMNGEGKCNWAQPGKMKKVLSFDLETDYELALPEIA